MNDPPLMKNGGAAHFGGDQGSLGKRFKGQSTSLSERQCGVGHLVKRKGIVQVFDVSWLS